MHRFFSRIIALILLPGLLLDPVLASVVQQAPGLSFAVCPPSHVFDGQAIVQKLGNFARFSPKTVNKPSIRLWQLAAPAAFSAPTGWIVRQTAGRAWQAWGGTPLPNWLRVAMGGALETVGILWGLPHLAGAMGYGPAMAPFLSNPWVQGGLFLALHLPGDVHAWKTVHPGGFKLIALKFSHEWQLLLVGGWIFGLGVFFHWFLPQNLHFSFAGLSPTASATWAHALAYNIILAPLISLIGILLPLGMADESEIKGIDALLRPIEEDIDAHRIEKALDALTKILTDKIDSRFSYLSTQLALYHRMAALTERVASTELVPLKVKAQLLHRLAFKIAHDRQKIEPERLIGEAFAVIEVIKTSGHPIPLDILSEIHIANARIALDYWENQEGTFEDFVRAIRSLNIGISYLNVMEQSDYSEGAEAEAIALMGWCIYHSLWLEDEGEAVIRQRTTEILNKALQRRPRAAVGLTLKGRLLLDEGKTKEAFDSLNPLLSSGGLIAQYALSTALVALHRWQNNVNRFKQNPLFDTLKLYALGLQKKNEADDLWARQKGSPAAMTKYEEARKAWEEAFKNHLSNIISVRHNISEFLGAMLQVEIRAGKIMEAFGTLVVFLPAGQLQARATAAVIARELPADDYPELNKVLRALMADSPREVLRFSRRLEEILPKEMPPYAIIHKIIEDHDGNGAIAEADQRDRQERIERVAKALEPVTVEVPAISSTPPHELVIPLLQEKVRRNPELGSIRISLGDALYKAGRYEEAIPQYQAAIVNCQFIRNLATDYMASLETLWKVPEASRVRESMTDLKKTYDRLHDRLEHNGRYIHALVYLLNRLGRSFEALRHTRPDAILQARNYHQLAAWLIRDEMYADLAVRLNTWTDLSSVLSETGEYAEALQYAEHAIAVAHKVGQVLDGKTMKESLVSRTDLDEIRATPHAREWLIGQEANARKNAAGALSGQMKWKESAVHLQEAFQFKLSKELEAIMRLMLGWTRYNPIQNKSAPEEGDILALESNLLDMDWILAAKPQNATPFHAAGLKALTLAKQQEWNGAAESALQGLVAGCAVVLGLDAESMGNSAEVLFDAIQEAPDPLRARIWAIQDGRGITSSFFRAIQHIAGLLGQAELASTAQRAAAMIVGEASTPDETSLEESQELITLRKAIQVSNPKPSDQWRYASILEREGRRYRKEGHLEAAKKTLTLSLQTYREWARHFLPFLKLSSNDRPWLIHLINDKGSDSLVKEMNTSTGRLRTLMANQPKDNANQLLRDLSDVWSHIGFLQWDIFLVSNGLRNHQMAVEAARSSLVSLTACDVLVWQKPQIPALNRVQILESAGFAAHQLNDFDRMLDFFERGSTLAGAMVSAMDSGLTRKDISNEDVAQMQKEAATRRSLFMQKEVSMRMMAGSQHYMNRNWDEAIKELSRVLDLEGVGMEKGRLWLVRALVARSRYMRMLSQKKTMDPEVLRDAIQVMDQILAAPVDIHTDAYLIRGFAAAQLSNYEGHSEDALEAASVGLTHAVQSQGAEVTTLNEAMAWLKDHRTTHKISPIPLVELLTLIKYFAAQVGKSELEKMAADLTKTPEDTVSEEPSPEEPDSEDQEEALAKLALMTRGPLPDIEELMTRLDDVYNRLVFLDRYQDVLNAYDPVIRYLNSQWEEPVRSKPLLAKFGIVWIANLRANVFMAMERYAEAVDAAEKGFKELNAIKSLCEQNKASTQWLSLRDSLRVALGLSLLRRWENGGSKDDLPEAYRLLLQAKGDYSGNAGKNLTASAHANFYASLGLAQFDLSGIEHDSKKSAAYLKSAEENLALSLAAVPDNEVAQHLQELITGVRQKEAALQKSQNDLLALMDTAIENGDLATAAQELDALEKTEWPPAKVIYYRGLLTYHAARKSGNITESVRNDQKTVEIWSARPALELVKAWEDAEKAHAVYIHLIESRVRVGSIPEAVNMAWTFIEQEKPDTALALSWAEALPDAKSYTVLADAFALHPVSAGADAFIVELRDALTIREPAPEWKKTALGTLNELTTPEAALQRRANVEWLSLAKNDTKVLIRFFTQKPWTAPLLTPERKIKLLIAWAPDFLKVTKPGKEGQAQAEQRKNFIVRFLDEVRLTLQASLSTENGTARTSIAHDLLGKVQKVFITDMEISPRNEYGFNLRDLHTIQDVLRGLKKPLEQALAVNNAQAVMGDLAALEARLSLAAAATDQDLTAAPDAAEAELDAMSEQLTPLRNAIHTVPAPQPLLDRYLALHKQVEAQSVRIKSVRTRILEVRRAALAQAEERRATSNASLLSLLRAHIARLRERVETAEASLKLAKRKIEIATLEKEWEELTQRTADPSETSDKASLAIRETEGLALIQRSTGLPEFDKAAEGWPKVVEEARQRIKRAEEIHVSLKPMKDHPIVRALLGKKIPSSAEELLAIVADALETPDLKLAIQNHFLTWLTAANEAEWELQGLPAETGYAISAAVERRLRAKVPAEDSGEPTLRQKALRENTLLEKVREVIGKIISNPQPVRLVNKTYRFISLFKIDNSHSVQFEYEFADLPLADGQARPIPLRLGPAPNGSNGSKPIRILVLLPSPPSGLADSKALSDLAMETATRAALYMGLGFGAKEAWAMATKDQNDHRNFNNYRFHELPKEDLTRLQEYRDARAISGPESAVEQNRTLLAILIPAFEVKGILESVPAAITELRQHEQTGDLTHRMIRDFMGNELVTARFNFIYSRLSATSTISPTPTTLGRAVSELGTLFDDLVNQMIQKAGTDGDGNDALTQIREDYTQLQAAHQERQKRARVAQIATGLLESLETILRTGATGENVGPWIQSAEQALSGPDAYVTGESLDGMRTALSDIHTALTTGVMPDVYNTLYHFLLGFNFHLFSPAHRWLWMAYDDNYTGAQTVQADQTLLSEWLPVGDVDGLVAVLTPVEHPSRFWYGQRLMLLSIPWLSLRGNIERDVLEILFGAIDRLRVRGESFFGPAVKSSQDMKNLKPTETEILEIARQFRFLLQSASEDEMVLRLWTLRAKMTGSDRATLFVLTQLARHFRLAWSRDADPEDRTIKEKIRRQGLAVTQADLRTLFTRHLNLTLEGGYFPEQRDGRWVLPVATQKLIEAIAHAIQKAAPGDTRVTPALAARLGASV